MRILVGHLYHESNTFCPETTPRDAFEFFEGADMIAHLPGTDVLMEAGAEIIPTIYAARWSSGTVEEEAFLYFENCILKVLEREKDHLDGIYLSMHGGMTVENIGSGEFHLLQQVRETAGRHIPLAISLDMHSNNQSGIERLVNVMTGYHTAPHTDATETQRKAARALLRLIQSGEENVHPALVRAPMLLIGERALSSDEPFRTIYDRCKALEKDNKILAATMYVGMAWGDTPNTTVTAAVTPASAVDEPYAREAAEWIADYIFDHRSQCRYAHPSYMPEEAVTRALESQNRPLYLSDSGDNPTAGGVGDGTVLLKIMLDKKPGKRVLFAPVFDGETLKKLKCHEAGETVSFSIGSGRDSYCRPVPVTASITRFGSISARHGTVYEKMADYALVHIDNVDVILCDAQLAFTGLECFETAGVSVMDYDIVVLKMGYMFAEISQPCRENIMAFTPGCTPLLITAEQYHHLPRPIWPLDNI